MIRRSKRKGGGLEEVRKRKRGRHEEQTLKKRGVRCFKDKSQSTWEIANVRWGPRRIDLQGIRRTRMARVGGGEREKRGPFDDVARSLPKR